MANKKDNYPSLKTPGVYPNATDKEIGLDATNLEELSLGNWNTLYRGNKLLLSGDLLEKIKEDRGIKVKVRTSPPKNGSTIVVWRYRRNPETGTDPNAILLAQGPIWEHLSDKEDVGSTNNRDVNGVKLSRFLRTKHVYSRFYRNIGDADIDDYDNLKEVVFQPPDFLDSQGNGGLRTDRVMTFDEGFGFIAERGEDEDEDISLVLDPINRTKLENYHVFEREITEQEQDRWGDGESDRGEDSQFTHELIAYINFDIQALNIDDVTLDSYKNTTWDFLTPNSENMQKIKYRVDGWDKSNNEHGLGENIANTFFTHIEDSFPIESEDVELESYLMRYPKESADAITLRGLEYRLFRGPDGARTSHPFIATNPDFGEYPTGRDFFQDELHNGGYGYYHSEADFGANIGAVDWHSSYRTDLKSFEDFWPQTLKFLHGPTIRMGNYDLLEQLPGYGSEPVRDELQSIGRNDAIEKWQEHFDFIGYPNFKLEIAIDNDSYVKELSTFDTPLNFIVNVTDNQTEKDLIYYDSEEQSESYIDTSYPLLVNLNLQLFDYENFSNDKINYDEDLIITAFGGSGDSVIAYLEEQLNISQYTSNPSDCYYKYQVIQWGDEKQLLTDDQIENSYFFSFYDSEEYPEIDDFYYRKFQQSQLVEAKPIEDISNYSYNTPGIKTIKIIVYRYTPDTAFILQTYLVTKNIVVNDGVLKSQDFAIFGASDFTLLPVTDNQAIIGGFDENSEYNDSVEKIVKDDQFLKEDYLDRISSKDYIDKFNDKILGENPGQLNLGNTRFFKKPRDIYSFIGGNKLEWINQGSGSLPINSLATDIFIDDTDCIVDLNVANSNYSVLENKSGIAKGILVGDYKVNQSEGTSVIKEGSMKTAVLDKVKDRQAF